MPTTREATDYLLDAGLDFLPGKAANAGGVAVSAIEMSQNASRQYRSFESVDNQLHDIMKGIFAQIQSACEDYNTEGNYVSSATGILASVVQFDPIRITFSLTDKQIGSLKRQGITKQHIKARIQLPSGEVVRMTSVDEYTDNSIDTTTATIAVYAEFPNTDELLIPGGYVNLNIDSGEPRRAITVNQSAIGHDQNGSYVMIVNKDNIVEQRRIKAGETSGSRQIITAGLSSGDRVIVQGLQKVSDGSTVRAENINAEEK